MDLAYLGLTLREPDEVYEAACGNPEPLAQRIRSGVEIFDLEREALAALICGELVQPSRKIKRLPYLGNTEADFRRRDLDNAVHLYRYMMRQIVAAGASKHGYRSKVAEYIAERDNLTVDAILDHYDHANKPSRVRRGKAKKEPSDAVQRYHRWLHEHGRLPEHAAYVSLLDWYVRKLKRGAIKR
ncbi:hypothetical protein [Loktanella sp. M215]|uniref:hypothetical protein n=1 Tax=Loktanella sp. M215 TaxID=2675431 RepID=UPI001F39D6E4|nr:hypothetical protein [Loktanella sp. M215]MCF7700931.1 hypothetical protein [Loktanella sp. M215]